MSQKLYTKVKRPSGIAKDSDPIWFGKYRGYRTLGEVPCKYLLYLYDNTDIDTTITEYINQRMELFRNGGEASRPKR